MKKPKQDIEFEVVNDREMTKEEVETIAHILFNAWKREFEKEYPQNHLSGDLMLDELQEQKRET